MGKQNTTDSYLLSFTAGGLLLEETDSLSSYLNDKKIDLIKNEIVNNKYLKTNSESARMRIIHEIKTRYNAVGSDVFSLYQDLDQNEKKIFIFYTCLKTYRLVFDFIFDVVIERWLSGNKSLNIDDSLYFLDKKSSDHIEVENLADSTVKKIGSVMIKMLKDVGMIDDGKLFALEASNTFWANFIRINETWFLQACLLNSEKRDEIRHV